MGQAMKYESFCGQKLALWIGMMLLLNCLIQEELYWIEDRLKAQMPSSSDSDVEYEAYQQALEQVWEELEYFPVPDSTLKDTEAVSFENTWQAERTYGGKRKHEGCDLIPEKEESGYYPVISMTDGTVERAGWLKEAGGSESVRTMAIIITMHIWNLMWVTGKKETRCRQETCLGIWETVVMDQKARPDSFQFIFMWVSICPLV